jgi:hypothetical protein
MKSKRREKKEATLNVAPDSALQPVSEDYVDRLMACLADGPDLLATWEKEHRAEGERER